MDKNELIKCAKERIAYLEELLAKGYDVKGQLNSEKFLLEMYEDDSTIIM